LDGAENRPVGGALALEAGVDYVLGAAGFVGLGDEAATVSELASYIEGKIGIRAYRQVADFVGDAGAVLLDVA